MRILLANDDGHGSPLLETLIEELFSKVSQLTVVVPKREQSWRGKAMTCGPALEYDRITIAGVEAHVIDGTPADCVNVALYHLCPEKPDLVISGPNIGSNLGISFVVSSGTIGACVEANIAGIPAMAISQRLAPSEYDRYRRSGALDQDALSHSTSQVRALFPRTLEIFRDNPRLLRDDVTWNINYPEKSDARPTFKFCDVGLSLYRSCFGSCTGGYTHNLRHVERDRRPETDEAVVESGHISISPLSFLALGRVHADLRREIEAALPAAADGSLIIDSQD